MSNKTASYYLTTPIYYVNAAPHLGTSYTSILADALARFERASQKDVFFLTGVDEHGEKVAQTAHEHNMDPQAWCDSLVGKFQEMNQALSITNTDFIRTTEERHKKTVQAVWRKLKEKGYVYKGSYDGWYCVPEETFFTETQVRHAAANDPANPANASATAENPTCPDCGRPLEKVSEESWFFKLSDFQQKLLDFYQAHPTFIEPATRKNEVISFVESGLKDLSVSRSSFDWGIQLPFDQKHVTYVWFDALLNYLTAVGYAEKPDQFAYRWPAQVQLVGKDIIRFHCVIWPALLMALDIEPPQKVFAHGFLTVKNSETGSGEKMSKSKGNVIAPQEVIDYLGVDGYRYYFMSDVKPGADGAISWSRMEQVYNADLANSWGNLVSRVLNMSAKYFDGKTPTLPDAWHTASSPLRDLAQTLPQKIAAAYEELAFDEALSHTMELVHRANLYIEEMEPWALAKDENKQAELALLIANLLEAIRICAHCFAPVMPHTSAEVLARLSAKEEQNTLSFTEATTWGRLALEKEVAKGEALFPRLQNQD